MMQLNFRYPFMGGVQPESDKSATTLLQNGTAVASVSNTGGHRDTSVLRRPHWDPITTRRPMRQLVHGVIKEPPSVRRP